LGEKQLAPIDRYRYRGAMSECGNTDGGIPFLLARAAEWRDMSAVQTRRFVLDCLHRGTQWAAFEPNKEPTWRRLRRSIGVFLHALFERGALKGNSPAQAYFVKVDRATMTHDDITNSVIIIEVGFAPLMPAEFDVERIRISSAGP
jgi:uncharacterized protein